jgi:cellulose synthase operon protein C
MRRLNLIFLAVLVIAATVLGGGIHLMHGFQMRRNASALLDRARRAESADDLAKAEESLERYLNVLPDDGSAWVWYASVVDRRIADRRKLERNFLVHEEALRHEPGDAKLLRRCADLALELGRYHDAHRHFSGLLLTGQATGAALAELEDLVGQCESGMGHYAEAEQQFVRALELDAGRVSCYDRLARLRRTYLRQVEAADATIEEMVAKNPKAGRAYIDRWRYFQDFTPPADVKDMQKGLELAPDDPEVLLTAGVASEAKADAAAARAYFEKGFKLDPKNLALALGLARLETRERHIDGAEKVLRRALEANPSVVLEFMLAENLIIQGKIDGKDQAGDYIARLRNAGLADTYVRYLEAEIPFQQKKWREAIPRIETARAVLRADPQFTAQFNLMLAECYGRVGNEERRLDALRRIAESAQASDSARIELVHALARSGKLDQAVTTLLPLAVSKAEWRLDLVRLLLQKVMRQPRDQRNWQELERHLREAEKALPEGVESLALLRIDVLAAQGRPEDARSVLSSALAKDPRNLRYRLTLARLTQRQGNGAAALQILDQAEKELGSTLDTKLARLDYWGLEGGGTARAAVAKLAESRQQIPAADRPVFLDRLGSAEIRLGESNLGRQHWRELAVLQPQNLGVRLGLFDLAMVAGDQGDAAALVDEIRGTETEGDEGTAWRFAQAALLIDRARRGDSRGLVEARQLASQISERRPQWASGIALSGEIAELAGDPKTAIDHYLRAVELGNVQPSLVRRLTGLLSVSDRNRDAEIDHVAQVVRDQGAALDEITMVKALDAIRKKDFDRGLALARQVFPETSTSSSDHLTLGRLYITAGRSNEAGKEFRRAVELGPGVPDTWLAYVQFLVQAKQIDQARAAVEAARKALPADRATLTLAQCSILLGDATAADELIGKAMSDEGKSADPAALRLATMVALGQNRLDKSDKYLNKFNQVADLSPGDKAWANRTRIAMLLSKNRPADRDQALQLVEQNLSSDANSTEDRALKATILALRPDRRGEAVTILEQLAGAKRLGANEQFLLAQLYLGQREAKKYQDEMQKLLDLKPRNSQHLAHFVNFWIGRSQLDQADRWLAELQNDDPRGRLVLELKARLFDVRKRRPELLALLEAYGRDVPDEIGPVADLLSRYGFAKEAELAYKAFAARNPNQPERSLALARFLARQDRVPQAMVILKKAWSTCRPEQVATAALPLYDAPSAGEAEKRQIEAWVAEAVRKQPDAVGLRAKLGSIWLWQGRLDEAADCFRRILASFPDNADALNSLAWLLALRDQRESREALELVDHAIDVTGGVPSLVDTRAVVLIRAGQVDRAVEELLAIRKQSPQHPSFALHLAWAYHAKGQTDQARRELQEADKLGLKPRALDPLELAVFQRLRKELFPG